MKRNSRKPVITDLIFTDETIANRENNLTIKGELPDTAWKVGKIKIDIRENQKKVIVSVFASRDPNLMAAQVVVRFKENVKIIFPSEGKWIIICNNNEVEVKVKKG